MTTFRVHMTGAPFASVLQEAKSPEDAANQVRKQYPGAIVLKVKRDRSGLQGIRRDTVAAIKDIDRALQGTPYDAVCVDEAHIINGRRGTVTVDELYEKQFPASLRIDRL